MHKKMALARKYRLTASDFKRVFKTGKTVRSSFFFIRFQKNNLKHGRIAVVVPSKTCKKSVDRNRIKRGFMEIIRTSRMLSDSVDAVFIVMSNFKDTMPIKEIIMSGDTVVKELGRQIMNTIALKIIKLYQVAVSPGLSLVGGYNHCRFHPSCSQYMYETIEKYGLITGIAKSLWRVIRCGPWSGGGVDPA